MPPKKTAVKKPKAKSAGSKKEELHSDGGKQPETDAPAPKGELETSEEEEHTSEPPSTAQSNISKKRKQPSSSQNNDDKSGKRSKAPTKTPRQGTRTSSRTAKTPSSSSSSTTPTPTAKQLITHLLSASSLPHAYPADELTSTPKTPSKAQLTYSYALTSPHTFTPFQHLLSASLLSKPLSHLLGLRSIRTLLNPPFNLTTPAAVTEAGQKRVWEALEVARTQHRQKTAGYVCELGKMCAEEEDGEGEKGWGEELEGLKKLAGEGDVQGITGETKKRVKGVGATGAEVFLRRVQCCEGWEGVWPFADGKAMEAVKGVGLGDVEDAEGLRGLVEEVVTEMDGEVGDMGLEGLDDGVSKEQRLRIAFVVVLERALGASLEGKMDEVKKAALAL